MKPDDQQDRKAYFAASRSWAEDTLGQGNRSRRTAWIVAGIAIGLALLEALALIILLPLKTVVPYTVMVDRQTGYVQVLDPNSRPRIDGDSALTKSLLAQYVIARESFDVSGLPLNYRKVGLWSAEAARSDYLVQMRAGNPRAPLAVYPRSTLVQTNVKSVSAIGPTTALVRFDTVRQDLGGAPQPPLAWASIVRYRFNDGPMSVADRFDNPLGFQVVRYHRDAEAIPPAVAPSAGNSAAVQPSPQLTQPAVASLATAPRVSQLAPPPAAGPVRSRTVDARSVPMGNPLGAPRP